MADLDIDPLFASVCSRIRLDDEEQPKDVLQHMADFGTDCLFGNRRIEILENDLGESELEFSTGKLSPPQNNEWEYVVVNFFDDSELDEIHIHSYFDIDTIGRIDEFYRKIRPHASEILMRSVEADVFINSDLSQLGFSYGGESDLLLEGVRFEYDSSEFSLYSEGGESIIRGGYIDGSDTLDETGYKVFVKEKLDELQSTVTKISS